MASSDDNLSDAVVPKRIIAATSRAQTGDSDDGEYLYPDVAQLNPVVIATQLCETKCVKLV